MAEQELSSTRCASELESCNVVDTSEGLHTDFDRFPASSVLSSGALLFSTVIRIHCVCGLMFLSLCSTIPHQELKAILPDTSYGAKDDLAAGLAAARSSEEVQRLVERAQYDEEVCDLIV